MLSFDWKNPFVTWPLAAFLGISIGSASTLPYGSETILLNGIRVSPWNEIFRTITLLGEFPVWILAIFILWFFFKKTKEAMVVAIIGVAMLPVNYGLKHYIGTDRPLTYLNKRGLSDAVVLVPDVVMNGGQTSFPSGHTTSSFGLSTLLLGIFDAQIKRKPMIAVYFILPPILVAFTRVFLAQHFIVDILGGAIFGVLWAIFGLFLLKKIKTT